MVKKTAAPAIYVTADEAVARLINLPHLADTYSLLELLSFFIDEIETSIQNAQIENRTDNERLMLERKLAVHSSRHALAEDLFDGIRTELQSDSPRIRTDKQSMAGLLNWQSVKVWALEEFEIALATETVQSLTTDVDDDQAKYSSKLRQMIGPRGYGHIKVANLMACFYVLLIEFAKTKPTTFFKHKTELNVEQLKDELGPHTQKYHPYFEPYGLGPASWKEHIQVAEAVLISARNYAPQKR